MLVRALVQVLECDKAVKSGSHRGRISKFKARSPAKARTKHPSYLARETVHLSNGSEVTLEIGPPVASDDSERWRVLADAALDPEKSQHAPPRDPRRDRERWLQALSHDGKDGKNAA